MKSKVTEYVDELQYRFRKGKGTKYALPLLRLFKERAIQKQKDMLMCSIDVEFDTL